MGLRGESRIQPPPPSFVISPSSINGSSKQRRRSERRLGTAQRGCRLFQMEELIEVASPVSGRELDPTLPPRCPVLPFPRITHSPLVGGRAGPRRPPPADVSAYSRPGGWSTCGRVGKDEETCMFAWGRGACRACVASLGHHLS